MARRKDPRQASLFGAPPPPAAPPVAAPAEPEGFDFAAARRLPPSVRFGTSTWTYEGWIGLVYRGRWSEATLRKRALAEYARWPWFRTVGIDHSFYGPPSTDTLRRYAAQVKDAQPDFRWCSKVWEHLTVPVFGRHPRYGPLSGEPNPRFLDPRLFLEEVLPPFADPEVAPHQGVFLMQFQSFGEGIAQARLDRFVDLLGAFFEGMPKGPRFGVEVRTRRLLGMQRYWDTLALHGAAHVFNHWDRMPALHEQQGAMAAAGGDPADFRVARLLTPLGTAYAAAVQRFKPYARLQEIQPECRSDTRDFVVDALDRALETFVLVNNRLEGNSPTTIDAIGRMIVDRLEGGAGEAPPTPAATA